MCFFVLRVDVDGLVVVCAQGKNIQQAGVQVVLIAQKLKAPYIFFHTKRPALAKLLKRFHFQHFSSGSNNSHVYRMVINGF
jgi:hypothetical protein